MFKKFEELLENDMYGVNSRTYYVGATSDIKALYKAIKRHIDVTDYLRPRFCGFPQFNCEKSVYALCIESTDTADWVTIVNSDTMLSIICDNNVKEVA